MGMAVSGLIKLRARTGKHPTFECNNCKCLRYSPCGCEKKGKKND